VGERVTGTLAEIYNLARQHWGGDAGASVVAKAINAGRPWAEVWQIMVEEIDAGAIGDAELLAQALLSGDFQRWQ
jgi:hypothetical protein